MKLKRQQNLIDRLIQVTSEMCTCDLLLSKST